MEAGDEGAILLEIADRLCAEFGHRADDEALEALETTRTGLFGNLLSPEEERLIAAARRSLARIAAALGAGSSGEVSDRAVTTLLDGAEVVMRSELIAGNRIAAVMPSFVFLITMPVVEQDRALELSERTTALLEGR